MEARAESAPIHRVRDVLSDGFRAHHATTPSGSPLRVLDLAIEADRTLLARIAATSEPVSTRCAARDYTSILTWYFCNLYPRAFRYASEHDAIVAVDQRDDLLLIYDVLAPRPFDLASILPHVVTSRVSQLEFGFTPDRLWPAATVHREDEDNAMFARGFRTLPASPFKFPVLAQT